MKQFLQYDEDGNIQGTCIGLVAPNFPRQVEIEASVNVYGKKVDIKTLELIDSPTPLDSLEAFANKWPYDKIREALEEKGQKLADLTADASTVRRD